MAASCSLPLTDGDEEDVQEKARTGRRMIIGKIVNEAVSDTSDEDHSVEWREKTVRGDDDFSFANGRRGFLGQKVTPRSKSRDLPARVTSASTTASTRLTMAKQKRRTLGTVVDLQEDMPGKIRKSNSENRRPPASQRANKRHSSSKGRVLGENNWSSEVKVANDRAIEKEVTNDRSKLQGKRDTIVSVGLTEDIDLLKNSPSTAEPPLLSSASSPPPAGPACLCSAELPSIRSSLSDITDKLATLTRLVLNLQPARQETAQDDLTHHIEEDVEDISREDVSIAEEDGLDSEHKNMMKMLHDDHDVIEKAHLDCSDEEIGDVINNDIEAAKRAALEDSDEDVDSGHNPWNDSSAADDDGIKTRMNKSESEESTTIELDRLCNLGNLSRRGLGGRLVALPAGSPRGRRKKIKSRQLRDLGGVSSGSETGSGDDLDDDSDYENGGVGGENIETRVMRGKASELESSGDQEDRTDNEDLESSADERMVEQAMSGSEDELGKSPAASHSVKVAGSTFLKEVDAVLPMKSRKRRSKRLENLLKFPLSESDEEEVVVEKNERQKIGQTKVKEKEDNSGTIVNEAALDTIEDENYEDECCVGEDCSCPSCRRVSKEVVKFTQEDLKSSAVKRKANKEKISSSLSPKAPQLDAYFDEVEVSFEELGSLPDDEVFAFDGEDNVKQILPSFGILQQVEQVQQQVKEEKVSVEDLWGFRDRKIKPGVKMEDDETIDTVGDTPGGKGHDVEDIIGEDEEEEYGVKETYSEYSPVYLSYGEPHPDPVVESSSLASVLPPAITRSLHLPQDLIDKGSLSKVQLEAVVYASQMHEVMMPNNSRAGYLIGDGAGVGKGRTIAGIILENWICGRRRAVWVSASQDLLLDAARDLDDIGAEEIKVVSLTKFGYNTKIKWEGVIYSTFAGLVGTTKDKSRRYKSRLEQLLDWLGQDEQFQGPLVFDECHKAKNLMPTKGGKPTKTGLAVLDLQNRNPRARVVYASATGASEPKNMAYMVRLGMWGQGINFTTFKDFSQALERRGTGGLEQVALDLKLRGNYIARQLSFKGVDFGIEEVPLTEEFIQVYDQSVEVWRKLQVLLYDLCSLYPLPLQRGDSRKRNFWGFIQKYFKYLAISSKISHVVGRAKKELAAGNCVVIGLQSTGEAATETEMITKAREKLADGYEDDNFADDSESGEDRDIQAEKVSQFSSAASKMIRSVVTKLIPCQHNQVSGTCDPARCEERKVVWEAVMELVPMLPSSSLDQLIEELGGPRKVAELTGRKKRLERGCDGVYTYVKRMAEEGSCDKINISEKKLFMSGKKKVAIISEAASTGISLQADKRVKNQRRRVHITIELPWSADSAIQQFGRTHRSNQSSAPRYVFIISALHGEKRFASIVAKRLESLGALTHGDRRSTRTSDLSTFNFHTDYAASALKNLVLAITEGENIKMPSPPPGWKSKDLFYTWLADRMEEAGIYSVMGVLDDEKYPTITKFMNRLLCVKVQDQNVIFSYFAATLDRVIAQAKREGRYDTGIVDVVGQEKATQVAQHSFEVKHATGVTTTKVTKFLITRGMSFEEAAELSKSLQHSTEGFWTSRRAGLKFALLAIAIPDAGHYRMWKFLVYRPNTGKVFTTMPYDDLREKYQKVKPEVARKIWTKQYELSMDLCTHAYKSYDHTCKIVRLGGECEDGRRRKTYHVSSGSLLSIWPQIENALGSCEVKSARKIQMVRINNEEGRIIGINIPNQVAGKLIKTLKQIDMTKWEDKADEQKNIESGGGKKAKTGEKSAAAAKYKVARLNLEQAMAKIAQQKHTTQAKPSPATKLSTVSQISSKAAQIKQKTSKPSLILKQSPAPTSHSPPVASPPSLLPCSPPTSSLLARKRQKSLFSIFSKQSKAGSDGVSDTAKFKFHTVDSKKPPQESTSSPVSNPVLLSPVVVKLTNKPKPAVQAEQCQGEG